MKNITFDVSVVIPFKDEVNMLQGFIDALLLQETNLSYELLIIDSSLESKENELNFYSLDYRYIKIKPSEFNHGQTRNCAVGLSKSNYILFTVQDAIPDKKNWLQLSVDVIKNNNLDACCGGQYVDMAPGKNPVEWSTSNYSLNCDILQFQPNKFADLSKEEQRQKSQWDNVNAIYKKESLLNLPFKEILFAEDAQWALDALQKGFKIGLATSSPIELIDLVVERCGIQQYIQVKTSAEHLPFGKPHPQVYLNCAEALGSNVHECICFEDSFNGLIAAKSARMRCVVVPHHSQIKDERWGAADLKLSSLQNFGELHFGLL